MCRILEKKFKIDFKAQWAAGYGWSGARSGRRLLCGIQLGLEFLKNYVNFRQK